MCVEKAFLAAAAEFVAPRFYPIAETKRQESSQNIGFYIPSRERKDKRARKTLEFIPRRGNEKTRELAECPSAVPTYHTT